MTLGEYPGESSRDSGSRWIDSSQSEFDIGKFRDVGHIVGVDRLNQAGGAVMDDFDGDGRLDVAVTSMDPTQPMAFYHNRGDGTFEDRSDSAGCPSQLGGLVCYQTDYNNDGHLDLFIPRGAWLPSRSGRRLLRNDGNGRFTDVTRESRPVERSIPTRRPGPTTTTTAGSTSSSPASSSPTASTTTGETALSRKSPPRPASLAKRDAIQQGVRLDRLRQRPFPRPVRELYERTPPAVSQQPRRYLLRRHGPMGIDGPRGFLVLGLGLRQ